MKKTKNLPILMAFFTILSSCSQDNLDTSENNVVPQVSSSFSSKTSGDINEQKYDDCIDAASYGLFDLSRNSQFIQLVREKVNERFDGDTNVLLKDLVAPCKILGIDLRAEMYKSLEKHNKKDLIAVLDETINGFGYFDEKAYIQIAIPEKSIPFAENPLIVINKYSQVVSPGFSNNFDTPTLMDIDEQTAIHHNTWIIGVNERVDNTRNITIGTLNPQTVTGTGDWDGSLWINKV